MHDKRFIFPDFYFGKFEDEIRVKGGEIKWKNLHDVFERDKLLQAHLKKAPKLNFRTLHPDDNKQNVQYALNVTGWPLNFGPYPGVFRSWDQFHSIPGSILHISEKIGHSFPYCRGFSSPRRNFIHYNARKKNISKTCEEFKEIQLRL